MTVMKLEEAMKAFELGAITKALIVPDWLGEGWNLALKVKNSEMLMTVITQRGGVKSYKTLDAAGNDVARIGLTTFEVHRKTTT